MLPVPVGEADHTTVASGVTQPRASHKGSQALRVPGPAANQARSWEQHPDGERYASTVFGCLCRKHVNVLQLTVTLVQQNATLLSRV